MRAVTNALILPVTHVLYTMCVHVHLQFQQQLAQEVRQPELLFLITNHLEQKQVHTYTCSIREAFQAIAYAYVCVYQYK